MKFIKTIIFLLSFFFGFFFIHAESYHNNKNGKQVLTNPEQQNYPKTLVLIICSDDQPIYSFFQDVWQSYMNLDPAHFECYFVRANPNLETPYLFEGNTLWTRGEESFVPGILDKTLHSIEAFQDRLFSFDYVIRTNLSSFFVFPRLKKYLLTAPNNSFYTGIVHRDDNWAPFATEWVCGAGIIISRDLAEMLLQNRENFESYRRIPDDVAIASFFLKKGISITPGNYPEVYCYQDWINIFLRGDLSNAFFFRIHGRNDRMILDLKIQRFLFDQFYLNTGRSLVTQSNSN